MATRDRFLKRRRIGGDEARTEGQTRVRVEKTELLVLVACERDTVVGW